ncbi:hypothetical protein Adt_00475 [Abeliophyllum distichum]|uniref:Uncharacterized protein n=1 Tax=Abeliophyllum distichum TaxID=126358 RepID=A0ABD1VQH5_9LAMI
MPQRYCLVKQLTKQSTESLSSKTKFWTEIEINVLEPGPVFNTVSLKQYSLPHRSNSSACFPGYSGVNCNCAVELKTCWNRITKRLEEKKAEKLLQRRRQEAVGVSGLKNCCCIYR